MNERAAFRSDLLVLLDAIDKRWTSEPEWDTPQGFAFSDFANYPTLAKYLNSFYIHPRKPHSASSMKKGGLHWLTFPAGGGAYSPDSMVDALCECIEAKTKKYAAKPAGAAEFYLLVHYDKALLYNTPVLGIDFGYAEAVKAASDRIGNVVGLFDRIFVFVPVANGKRAFQLYP